jgi:hypothetical protein
MLQMNELFLREKDRSQAITPSTNLRTIRIMTSGRHDRLSRIGHVESAR